MIRNLVNRENELSFLREQFESNTRQFIVLYGRRRVGKTELVTKFLDERNHIYFLADQRGTKANAQRFAQTVSEFFNDIPPDVTDFDEVLTYIRNRTDSDLIVVIDEFSYLVEMDESIPSVFQLIWDDILDQSRISLILLGSSISMMEEGALSYESPLYERRTGQWKLAPLSFGEARQFFPDYSFADQVRVYSVLGGVPAYLEKFDPSRAIIENIRTSILSKGTFLYEEPEFLLRQELRKPASYMAILEAMAFGATRVTEIANATNRDAKNMSQYLSNLRNLELVEKIVPVTASNQKRGIYRIRDEFFRFWFRFLYPNLDDLERRSVDSVADAVKTRLDYHASTCFEEICREAVRRNAFPFTGSATGTWWYKEDEIDVVALNENTERILLGECKWTKESVGSGLLNDLEEKASQVRWRGEDREEVFTLFSRSGFTDALRTAGSERDDLLLYDLSALEGVFA